MQNEAKIERDSPGLISFRTVFTHPHSPSKKWDIIS